ncbi:hypothetical protein B0H13DRAFT_2665119 [Mycena leptocephala]|nr:hypothetical protein B0H13DRAFT_2665119 [Mycena leptocephala]
MQNINETNAEDTELLRRHQTKSETQLAESHNDLHDVDARIQVVEMEALAFERKITDLEGEEAILLGALAPTSSVEVKQVREDIGDAKCLLRVAEKQLKALAGERELVLRKIAALSIPITLEAFHAAPIRRVPTDILVAIFMATKPDGFQLVGTGPIPVLLQVCSKWRAVASDHPALWSSFSCGLFPHNGFPNIKLVELYLARSKAAPLTIEVISVDRSPGPAETAPMISLLAEHAENLYSLRLTGTWYEVELRGFGGRLPRLEILQLSPLAFKSSGQFEIAPRLHTVILTKSYTSEVMPFEQICSMDFKDVVTPAELEKFPNITSLTCTFTEGYLLGLSGHIVLRHLSSLRIDFARSAYASNMTVASMSSPIKFFDHYSSPALESLEISSLVQPANLGDFIQRSQCDLKTLVLKESSVRIAELLQIFEFSPSLDSVTVEDGTTPTAITDRLLAALTVHPESAALLPKLTHLCIEGQYMFRDAILLEMLESRTVTALHDNSIYLPLELAELWLERVMVDADVQRFRDLEGVDVSLSLLDGDEDMVEVI